MAIAHDQTTARPFKCLTFCSIDLVRYCANCSRVVLDRHRGEASKNKAQELPLFEPSSVRSLVVVS
jgi:hypothetical protein